MTSILFVCLGNICRSPAAEAVFRSYLQQHGDGDVVVDSAGTAGYHVGEPPDRRMQAALRRRGYTVPGTARQVSEQDFTRFDLIVAMDRQNHAALKQLAARAEQDTEQRALRLLSEFLPGGQPLDVPDPYYGGSSGFETVLDLLERANPALRAALLVD